MRSVAHRVVMEATVVHAERVAMAVNVAKEATVAETTAVRAKTKN